LSHQERPNALALPPRVNVHPSNLELSRLRRHADLQKPHQAI
jgi:hypothetical protein